jgi:hypothetical protein
MNPSSKPLPGAELKIFDPRDPSTASLGVELSDSSVVRRNQQWWMYLTGQPAGFGPSDLFSASLAPGAPLSGTGWTPTRTEAGELAALSPRRHSGVWDGNGGRHCPSYVRGWDPAKETWIERIYYAGAADHLWGPYTIGFLEWDGELWIDRPQPAFIATEPWEHGSVFEPNLIYHEGKWKMWYVAGSHHEDYLVHGYAESDDGRTGWSERVIFAPPEMKLFDFCVRPRGTGFDAIFARVWSGKGLLPPETGLWWCQAERPSRKLSDWSSPVHLMTAANRGWHTGPWKPSFDFDEQNANRALVFFDGLYPTHEPGPFPFAFTLGCVPVDLP